MKTYEATEQAYKNGYEQGKKDALKWIPVSERLPEDDLPKGTKRLQIKVLVTTNHKGKKFVRVITRERWEFPVGNMRPWIWSKDATNVTHWMPLPEPPKGE